MAQNRTDMKYYSPLVKRAADTTVAAQQVTLTPVAMGCTIVAGPDGWRHVMAGESVRPGISFPATFRVGEIAKLQMSLRPRLGQTFRIEAHGLTTRMGKAVVTLAATSDVLSRAEEVTDLSVVQQPDGSLQISVSFVPFRSRKEAWFLWLEAEKSGSGDAPLFEIAPATLQTRPIAPHQPVSQDHMSAVQMGDVWIACQQMAFFRNSLHLEFEVHKPGVLLAGMSLHSPLPLGPVQWWTPDAHRLTPTSSELIPRVPHHPLPAAAMMDRFGPDVPVGGHVISALFEDYVNFERMPLDVTDGARDLILVLRFTDGAVRRVSLQKVMNTQGDGQEAASFVESALTAYCETLDQKGVFLEVGARGPSSMAMRQRRQAEWNYIGVDYQADANVDFVVDAHRLAGHFAEGSVDVIYSAEVMEHLLSPLTFVLEANRVLKNGGLFIASVPTMWPLHAEPWDYWRFTSHCWKGLLNCNTGFKILRLAETSSASVVPLLPTMSGLTRMQQSPAPTQSLVLARRIGSAVPGTTGWTPGLESGAYDHA